MIPDDDKANEISYGQRSGPTTYRLLRISETDRMKIQMRTLFIITVAAGGLVALLTILGIRGSGEKSKNAVSLSSAPKVAEKWIPEGSVRKGEPNHDAADNEGRRAGGEGCSVRVITSDEAGRQVGGVELRDSEGNCIGQTDDQGVADVRLDGRSEHAAITASKEGFFDSRVEVSKPWPSSAAVVMERAYSQTIEVRTAWGDPIEDASLRIGDTLHENDVLGEVRTDSEGKGVITDLRRASLFYYSVHVDGYPATQGNVRFPFEKENVVLRRPVRLYGTVTESTGGVLSGVSVWVHRKAERRSGDRIVASAGFHDKSDEEGHYQVVCPEDEYTITAKLSPYVSLSVDQDVRGAEEIKLDLALEKGVFIEGMVLDAGDEQPIAWCYVYVHRGDGAEDKVLQGESPGQLLCENRAGADGRFRIGPVSPEGKFTLRARLFPKYDSQFAFQVDARKPVVFRMLKSEIERWPVDGVVREHMTGKPVEGGFWAKLVALDEKHEGPVSVFQTAAFRFENISPGRYKLEVGGDLYETAATEEFVVPLSHGLVVELERK